MATKKKSHLNVTKGFWQLFLQNFPYFQGKLSKVATFTTSMEVTNRKRDFEKSISQLGWVPFNDDESWGSSPMALFEEFEKKP